MALVKGYIGMRTATDESGDVVNPVFAIGEIARLRAKLNALRRTVATVGTQTDTEGWIVDSDITIFCSATNSKSTKVKRRRVPAASKIIRKAELTIGRNCRVMARWHDNVWYHGVARTKNNDGSFVVEYDDGDTDRSVPIDRVRVACAVCEKTTPHRWIRATPWTCVRCYDTRR